MIPANALPGPSNYAIRMATGVFESQSGMRRMHLIDQPDSQNQGRVFLLTWQNVRHEVANAVFDHYEAHGVGTFAWLHPNLPETGEEGLHVRWLTPPSITRSTPVSASLTGELEAVLAFTP